MKQIESFYFPFSVWQHNVIEKKDYFNKYSCCPTLKKKKPLTIPLLVTRHRTARNIASDRLRLFWHWADPWDANLSIFQAISCAPESACTPTKFRISRTISPDNKRHVSRLAALRTNSLNERRDASVLVTSLLKPRVALLCSEHHATWKAASVQSEVAYEADGARQPLENIREAQVWAWNGEAL